MKCLVNEVFWKKYFVFQRRQGGTAGRGVYKRSRIAAEIKQKWQWWRYLKLELALHHYHCFHNSLVDCITGAAVRQHREFENFSTTLLQHCWSYLHWLVTFHEALLLSRLCKHGEPRSSSFGSDEFAMFAAIFRSPFENTIIDPAVTLFFMSDVHES